MDAPRAVRVVTEVGAVDRPFDYLVPSRWANTGVGDRVRVDFNGRSVRGWVVGDATVGDDLKPLSKWLGYGPPPSMMALLTWSSERWFAPLARFLVAASPRHLVTSLPSAPRAGPLEDETSRRVSDHVPGVIQHAPTTDPLDLVLAAYRSTRADGASLLVVTPTEARSRRLRGRLEQRGCAVAGADEWERCRAGWPIVVGARGAAFAPVPRLAGAVVLDADDEALRSPAQPTWHAIDVLEERCRRAEVPWWATTMLPSPRLMAKGWRVEGDIRGGWPRVTVIDRRVGDPHDGLLARESLSAVHRALTGDEAVAVVVLHQRLGRGRLLACAQCHELYRCAVCGQGEEEVDDGVCCQDAHERRLRFCRACGSTRVTRLRQGVSAVRRDLEAQIGQPVGEVTAASTELPSTRVVVGTEAVLQRVRRSSLVIIDDFDQYLLAPRETARRQAVDVVGRAGRLVGARRAGRGDVIVQTRRGDDLVVRSLVDASFDQLLVDEYETARALGLAPFGARATIRGVGAAHFVASLGDAVTVAGDGESGFVVRASDVAHLVAVLRGVPRPPAVRVAVD